MQREVLPTKPAPPGCAAAYRTGGHWLDVPIGRYLPWCAAEYGDTVAVVDGDRRATFADVERQAAAVAAALIAEGVGAEDVVSFQLPNWLEAVVVYQAVMKIGAVANPIVPIYRGHELRHILRQAGTKVAVIPAAFRGFDFPELYRRLRPELPDLTTLVIAGEGAEPDEGERSWEELAATSPSGETAFAGTDADPDHIALLLYTSGTTAEPKGALHSHNTLVFDCLSMAGWFRLNERDVIFTPSPVTHITGVLCGLTMPFVLGCPVVLQDTWQAERALELIERERASFMIFATPFLSGLTTSDRLDETETSSIRAIACGGADIPVDLVRAANERLGPTMRMYGATEAPSTTCTNRWDSIGARVGTDGRWIPPTEGAVVDDDGRPAPPGTVGEILWRGPDMFLGYLDAALNDAAFTDDGWFRTGDLGVMDDEGYLRVQGRLKDIVNRAGEKISVYEVESLLFEHPRVREVAVVATPDPKTGEKACAFVVPDADEGELDLDDLSEFLVGREVAKQKIPERLVLVDELPKTPSGKVQKFMLREWASRADEAPSVQHSI